MNEDQNLSAADFCEDLIADCVPGGSVCDPRVVADAIRAFFKKYSEPLDDSSATIVSEMPNRPIERHFI